VIGLGLSLTQVAVRGSGRTFGAAIIISGNNQDENTAIGTTIGNVSVVGGTGTYTFTKTADPDSAFTFTSPALKNAIVFDYETATGHNVTIHADNGAGSVLNRTFNIGVNDIDEVPPTITFSLSQTIPENSAFSLTLTADKPATWAKTGGADTALFTLTGNVLTMAAKDFEIPTDANADNAYIVQVTATSAAYAPATTNQTITVSVTNIGPTITSSATQTTPENAAFSMTLTASESVTWAKTGGADTALLTLSGATLSMTAKDFEIPTDANTDNVYVVTVTATSVATSETASQTINVTVTDVADTLPAPGTPTIVWTSATSVTPPVFSFSAPTDPDLVVGDNVHFQRSSVSDFSSGLTDYNNTVDSTEDAANALTFSSGTWADGTWWVRARTERTGAANSAWSNTETKTLATVTAVTMDPAHSTANITLSGGNLVVTGGGSATLSDNVRSTASHATGKYYCEFGITTDLGGQHHGQGLVNGTFTIGANYVGSTNNGVGGYTGALGQFILINAANVAAIGSVLTGGTVGMAVDLTAHLVWFTIDGSTWTSGSPSGGTGGVDISALGAVALFPAVDIGGPGNVTTVNFGATTYVYTRPTGFSNW
jgi:hypothetical protein